MDIAMGVMNTLLPKLAKLMVGEYKLQKSVKGEIKELEDELISMTTALHKVAEVPPDQLDEQVKIWASYVRELSYDIEDEVDTFMLHDKEHEHTSPFRLEGLIGKAADLYKKAKTNHKIYNVIKDIKDQVKKVAERRDRYKIDNIAARLAMVAVDPRLEGMYRKATELVGIGQPKKELAKRLLEQIHSSTWRQQSNIVSIVGFGGLGKTTLANSLLQDLKAKFDFHIFVSVTLNPDIRKIFKNILLQLDEKKYSHLDEGWEVNQLIDKIIEFLQNRRCLCVIDDLWKESAWDAIKLAFPGGHPESKITTCNKTVAEHVGGGVYELKPLSDFGSRKLFNKRIFDTDEEMQQPAGTSLEEIGENYFSELINRSLIQAVEEPLIFKRDGLVHSCQVHDMVHELINQLSAEEAFVTTLLLDGQQVGTSTPAMQQQKIRRLSLRNSNKSYGSPDEAMEKLCKVRSLDIFGKVESIPPLSSFLVLRVLQVDDCSGLDNNHVNDLGKLRLLRFLRLHGLNVTKLPESIGELESLETLDIRGSMISLPLSFGKLVTEIGKLRQLKVLGLSIFLDNFDTKNELIFKCLQMCPSIQVLFLEASTGEYPLDFMEQVPCGLQRFVSNGLFMMTSPRWINPSLSRLTAVTIGLHHVDVQPEHLDNLAGLPSLRFLRLYALHCSQNQEMLICPSGASAFPCLTELQFECPLMFLKFQHGAMRKLQRLQLSFDAMWTNRHFATNFDYGLENVPSLRHVAVQLIPDLCKIKGAD
ncbi:unnamed protein product [Miscanthus lutarioriparius]|uniref:Uncharacterized protein n=1 Tax=Miscanthus lutarioriparius TaxID=422564 RepID=A0A811NQF2_9POAL|nr:unnamed protein product [Miscanthus lutarioriparius]